ncbi:hypothetical protein AVEN_6614-1 [Araneus ventricosus]|uniref:Uncharacterized protein n=1 Tax=Araneus ventricosus TaxID=182803 RepID=A0A4Y2KZZ7_ARAVE|nr:hypothetical protein AVEN_6614-1 [Araneus ventricosus]
MMRLLNSPIADDGAYMSLGGFRRYDARNGIYYAWFIVPTLLAAAAVRSFSFTGSRRDWSDTCGREKCLLYTFFVYYLFPNTQFELCLCFLVFVRLYNARPYSILPLLERMKTGM